MDNPFATIMATLQSAWINKKASEALIESRKIDPERIDTLLYIIKTLMYIDNSELNSKFDSTMDQLLGRKKVMGVIETVRMLEREKTEAKTRNEEKKEFVTNLIQKLGLSDDQAADVATVSVEFVRKIRASLAKKAKN
ncbi:hypothetical protein SAMN05216436_103191 [bacterium A37T11]|nr:hypothetical protein SAMN05216436_103191 [bacterium A37T11]